MTYIDKLLLKLLPTSDMEKLPARDVATLRSMGNSVDSPYFITENQSRLLLNILKTHHHMFGDASTEILSSVNTPNWSRPFRVIEQVKKMYINKSNEDNPFITIDFTFSANIRKTLTQASNVIEDLVQEVNGKSYMAALTEKNIVILVDKLRPLGFNIDPAILEFYDTIMSWKSEDIKNNFLINTMTSQNFHKQIADDLGVDTPINQNIIHDRSIRYRFFPTEPLIDDGTLTAKIAGRGSNRVWLKSTEYSLTEVIKSLIELRRLPLMVIFDSYDANGSVENMQKLSDALKANNVDKNVGIYFRMQNNDNGSKFNDIIAENKYNQYLGPDTEIVGVQSGKIPKFFLTNSWKPMSVIAIGTQLRNSKTAVYASCCDLGIVYSELPPIVENTFKWP